METLRPRVGENHIVVIRIEVAVNLQRLFSPDCIAIIGASQTEGKIGYEAMANATAFSGSVYPVNPSSSGMVFGESFVTSVTEINDTVDLALLCVPGPVVPNVLEECGEANVGGAVIYAGGFAETGEEGERLQERIVEVATEHDIALLGPNTSGFVVPSEELFASFASGVERIRAGNVAVIAQSGGVAHVLAFQARREQYGLSGMVGLGNRANVGFQEVVTYFDADERTDAILLHVEGTDDGRELLETCRDAETPVVAYKVGKTDVGDFAESHTGALTGEHELYMAGFEQYGVLTAESTSELIDAGVALGRSPSPSGPNVGVVTAQAGPGIIIADRIQQAGGNLPDLTATTQERLEELLPGITYSGNPVDTGRPMPEFGEIVSAVAEDDRIDIVLVYELFEESLGFPIDELDGLAERVDKPVLFATDGVEEDMADDLASLWAADVPVFTSPERGAEATGLLAKYAVLSGNDDRTEVNADV